jgi:hypothetical protein
MTQAETKPDRANKSSLPNTYSAGIRRNGAEHLEELLKIKTEIFEALDEAKRSWFDRVQLEADLASELRAKLTKARSIPETATAYQDWVSRRTEMAVEDTRRLLADGQKLMETGVRLLANGWRPNGHGGST